MDMHGVAVSTLYGNLGVSRNFYADIDDEGFRLDIVRTYNDFLIDWVAPAPDRFIPLANVPFWNPQLAADETARAAKLGHKGIVTTGIPERHGLPPFADHAWDVLWQACSELRMPIHFHSGGGDISAFVNAPRQQTMGAGEMMAAATTNIILDTAASLSDLLHSAVLPRFPDTRWVIVESAVGYIPFVLECADEHFARLQARETELYEALPSDYFRRQVYGTYWFEQLDQHLLDRVGAGNIMFETDYPHPTCLLRDDIVRATNECLSGSTPTIARRSSGATPPSCTASPTFPTHPDSPSSGRAAVQVPSIFSRLRPITDVAVRRGSRRTSTSAVSAFRRPGTATQREPSAASASLTKSLTSIVGNTRDGSAPRAGTSRCSPSSVRG